MGGQVMKYYQLLEYQQNKTLKMRAIIRILETTKFKELYQASLSVERDAVIKSVKGHNIDYIKEWMKNHRCNRLEELSNDVLKSRARAYKITNWSRMTKKQLIEALENDKKATIRDDNIEDSGDETSSGGTESGDERLGLRDVGCGEDQ